MDLKNFDPDGVGIDNGNYFGLPSTPEESALVLVSVPWDVTSSYGTGSAFAPDAIIGASTQMDFYDPVNPDAWRRGIGTVPIDYSIQEGSLLMREEAKKVIRQLESGKSANDVITARRRRMVNERSAQLNEKVYDECRYWLGRDKTVGLVGGDHSTPFGLIRALSELSGTPISILHIDAHADLREAYEGFTDSHASIMYNVMTRLPEERIERLVQVGVRDRSGGEAAFAAASPRIVQFDDYTLASRAFRGATWDSQCAEIIEQLGERVYISFDIDGLTSDNAPHTGTPVPGGLTFNQAVYLVDRLAASGRRIVGFDLCEVVPAAGGEWDANVGARVLYKLCNFALRTRACLENLV
ncbi:MAG: agmatinase family protein [Rikenellaceae bacterium]|nr:agmatinase family protein [Rikenellaceae bacterium]MCL2693397.1 agmatinase family protein [Rikenellaceae bacterium]